MVILILHNKYKMAGGEDVVFGQEVTLLKSNGHTVHSYVKENNELDSLNSLTMGLEAIWSSKSKSYVESFLRSNHVDIIHSHNYFSRLSPSIYYAASKYHVPVVQTLHNYRLICPSGTMFRNGRVCEKCLGHLPYPAVKYRCYKSNRIASTGVATMVGLHRLIGTWKNKVNLYIAVSQFLKDKFVQSGFPEEKIVVKPNFLEIDPGIGAGGGGYILFVGRLTQEKGIETLLNAWRYVKKGLVLSIVGDGPLKPLVEQFSKQYPSIEYKGSCARSAVLTMMKQAEALVVPSLWYEPFGLVVLEAFACGLPVITTGQGGLSELVSDDAMGLYFSPDNILELAEKINILATSPVLRAKLAQHVRNEYETKYTPGVNYRMLERIYTQAMNIG